MLSVGSDGTGRGAQASLGMITRMWARPTMITGASQGSPEPSSSDTRADCTVKNSWSRRFTWSDRRLRCPSRGSVTDPSIR